MEVLPFWRMLSMDNSLPLSYLWRFLTPYWTSRTTCTCDILLQFWIQPKIFVYHVNQSKTSIVDVSPCWQSIHIDYPYTHHNPRIRNSRARNMNHLSIEKLFMDKAQCGKKAHWREKPDIVLSLYMVAALIRYPNSRMYCHLGRCLWLAVYCHWLALNVRNSHIVKMECVYMISSLSYLPLIDPDERCSLWDWNIQPLAVLFM